VRALQVLSPQELSQDVAFLSAHSHWAARSLAAVVWASNSPVDVTIGLRLARDPDLRVRRSLADTVRTVESTEAIERTKAALESDPRHSVRRLLHNPRS
jgi:hypothetical protein